MASFGLHRRNMLLKVSIGQLFDLDVEINTPIAVRVECEESEGTTSLLQYMSGKDFKTSFPFEYFDASDVEFCVVDRSDNILARAVHSLASVVDNGYSEEVVHLHPGGKLSVRLHFMEGPVNPPKWCTVQVYQAMELKARDLIGKIDPYCIIKLDDEEVGKTPVVKSGGNNVSWDNAAFDIPFESQRLLCIEVYDKDRIGSDDIIGDAVVDLWDVLKNNPKPNIRGYLPLAGSGGATGGSMALEPTGRIELGICFWDEEAEKLREQLPMDSPGPPAPVDRMPSRGRTSSSSSSSSSSRTHSSERRRRAEEAEAARRRAEEDAARKRAEEEAARKKAEEDLRKAHVQREAEELARKARDAAARAQQHHNDTYDVALAHPSVDALLDPLKRAEKGSKGATDAAALGRRAAEDCGEAPTLDRAEAALAAARQALDQALKGERAALEALKDARKLARKEEKRKEKRLQRMKELEDKKRKEEAEARERARQAEHLKDLELRRVMINPTEVNENRLYQGVTGYSYHNVLKNEDDLSRRSGGGGGMVGGPFACCSPAAIERGVKRSDSQDSLSPAIPKHELRGLKGIHSGSEDFDGPNASPANAGNADENVIVVGHKQILLEDDGIIETLHGSSLRRPRCWCFGCGCMKCCGEC
eukprot:Protomagalhaensia_sp_Gyna_25__5358@NODE_682_length_2845_cov_375_846757_g62_i2_p1_GENE_NODE_682_length_2845_cov_375_846757_g62_i2NODE_682_length_2845_cov_375_846757_g62_i2_p1_ORF_typecomplete_len647_score165_73C2/PF00168_30/2_1e02C2/PF00168_30/1_3e17SR25/PF10500_9/0_0048SR25/PF10500_9/46Hamartin/PF04388_12/0_18SMC_N/PF02463_19/0_68TTKRSYEDQ/PF10212_9/1_3TTKRSYEDQ/PF10212_9/1_8e04ZapA/PF05164_13/13ZapA/PF05164_13/4_6CAF1_p150/PF11600_8/11CAF1_p150/PF11600_8/5_2U79_P34/PF03064_16/4_3U79_P34/PF03064